MANRLYKVNNNLFTMGGKLIMTPFEPTWLTGCQLWLDASAGIILNNGSASTWLDKSGLVNNAIQNTEANQPAYISNEPALNNKPVLRFDGVDDFMSFNEISTIRTAFFIVKHTSGINVPLLGHSTLYDWHGGVGANLLFTGVNTSPNILNGQFFINSISADTLTALYPTDYVIYSFITTDTVTAEYITNDRNLGEDRCWGGDYAEIIIYNRALTTPERQQVEDYLNTKYNLY